MLVFGITDLHRCLLGYGLLMRLSALFLGPRKWQKSDLACRSHTGKKEREVKIYFRKLWCFRKTNETIEAGFTALFSQLKWREKQNCWSNTKS